MLKATIQWCILLITISQLGLSQQIATETVVSSSLPISTQQACPQGYQKSENSTGLDESGACAKCNATNAQGECIGEQEHGSHGVLVVAAGTISICAAAFIFRRIQRRRRRSLLAQFPDFEPENFAYGNDQSSPMNMEQLALSPDAPVLSKALVFKVSDSASTSNAGSRCGTPTKNRSVLRNVFSSNRDSHDTIQYVQLKQKALLQDGNASGDLGLQKIKLDANITK
ncbi:hypothetical protein MIR68_010413 [Amoeboaphelidium protococcarum]|nr:hypothetical protein MIR68_010413 [Amoeboaphelidium protococcarum]